MGAQWKPKEQPWRQWNSRNGYLHNNSRKKKQVREKKQKNNGEEEVESLKTTYPMTRRRQSLEENEEETQRRRNRSAKTKEIWKSVTGVLWVRVKKDSIGAGMRKSCLTTKRFV